MAYATRADLATHAIDDRIARDLPEDVQDATLAAVSELVDSELGSVGAPFDEVGGEIKLIVVDLAQERLMRRLVPELFGGQKGVQNAWEAASAAALKRLERIKQRLAALGPATVPGADALDNTLVAPGVACRPVRSF